jgi:hypothetical protein
MAALASRIKTPGHTKPGTSRLLPAPASLPSEFLHFYHFIILVKLRPICTETAKFRLKADMRVLMVVWCLAVINSKAGFLDLTRPWFALGWSWLHMHFLSIKKLGYPEIYSQISFRIHFVYVLECRQAPSQGHLAVLSPRSYFDCCPCSSALRCPKTSLCMLWSPGSSNLFLALQILGRIL